MSAFPELGQLVAEIYRLMDLLRQLGTQNEALRDRSERREADIEDLRNGLAELREEVQRLQAERTHVAEILQALVEDLGAPG